MPVTADRSVTINTTGDRISNKIYAAAPNTVSPGVEIIYALIAGPNTITVPLVTGFTCKAATIIPPSTNTQAIALKGVAGDTGIPLSKVDPSSIALDTPAPVSIVLAAGGTVDGLRIVWT